MAKSTTYSNDILALIFNAIGITNIADNAASSPLTYLYIALHTDDPGVGGDPRTNEATYTGYSRKSVARSTDGWSTPDLGSTHNAALLQFVECSGGSNIITHVSICTTASGAGKVLYAGQLSSPRSISSGIQPQFSASALVVTET